MADPLDALSKLLSEYRDMTPVALVVTGISIGLAGGWAFWQQQNSNLRQENTSLKEAVAEKLPADLVAHLLTPRERILAKFVGATTLTGLILAGIWYFQSSPATKAVVTVIHVPATSEQIKQAAGGELAKLGEDRDDLRRQRDALQQQLQSTIQQRDNALRQANLPPAEPAPKLTPAEIATKIGVWNAINQRMNALSALLNQGYASMDHWEERARLDRGGLTKNIGALAASIEQFRAKLDELRNLYGQDKEITTILLPVYVPGGRIAPTATIFLSLPNSLSQFSSHLRELPEPLPEDIGNEMIPYVGAVMRDLNAIRDWQSHVRQTGAAQIALLSR
jgi:hypothetical protein